MLKAGLLAVLRFYQRFLSPLKRAPSCRYVPTCSSYAIEALTRHGMIVGSAKTLWRLLRCHPLFPGGYDPVVRDSTEGRASSEQLSERAPAPAHACAGEHCIDDVLAEQVELRCGDDRPQTQSVRI